MGNIRKIQEKRSRITLFSPLFLLVTVFTKLRKIKEEKNINYVTFLLPEIRRNWEEKNIYLKVYAFPFPAVSHGGK